MNFKFCGALISALLTACGHNEPVEPSSDPRVDEVMANYNGWIKEAQGLQDANGWLTPSDKDGMLWSAKASAGGLPGFRPEAAEIAPGRFVRCPDERCRKDDNDLWSDWSRDMFNGLLWHAWRTKDLALLERHLAYGRAHNWIMGAPFGDGRSVYLPATYGRLYQAIFALGGSDDAKRLWPDVYASGLSDYQAHHQLLNVGFRGEVEEFLREDGDARLPSGERDDSDVIAVDENGQALHLTNTTTDVDDTQLARIKEHAAREPRNPFYQCLNGIYTGDMGPALELLKDPSEPVGEYVRCDEFRRCQLAELIFAAKCVLRRY